MATAAGGLAVGFRAVLYAWELFESDSTSEDEEIVCIAETDACGVDAIQALLSCTVGKGNLIFNLQGKNAFSFYRRSDGKSFRLVLRPTPEKTKEERLAWLMDGDYHEMFDVKEAPGTGAGGGPDLQDRYLLRVRRTICRELCPPSKR